MNVPQQDQARPGQSSAEPLPGAMTPSDAARILANRRTALREEAATQATQEAKTKAPGHSMISR